MESIFFKGANKEKNKLKDTFTKRNKNYNNKNNRIETQLKKNVSPTI